MVSPQHKQGAVEGVVKTGLCSQRRACRYLGLHRSSSRYERKAPTDWLLRLHQEVEALSRKHPRLGYRKLTRLLREDGWQVGRKLVQRIRRECGLRVKRWRKRTRRRGRSTGTIPTRAERLNHVWSWDFVADRTDNGGKLHILTCLDRELMLSVAEARVLIEDYRRHYNEERPHGGIGYRTPAQACLESLGSSRPSGSLRQELESTNTPVTLKT
jgi:putative transposase